MENVCAGHESRFGYAKWSFWDNKVSKIINERFECCNHFNKLLTNPKCCKKSSVDMKLQLTVTWEWLIFLLWFWKCYRHNGKLPDCCGIFLYFISNIDDKPQSKDYIFHELPLSEELPTCFSPQVLPQNIPLVLFLSSLKEIKRK